VLWGLHYTVCVRSLVLKSTYLLVYIFSSSSEESVNIWWSMRDTHRTMTSTNDHAGMIII
jgi:hypothetical protein